LSVLANISKAHFTYMCTLRVHANGFRLACSP
jgi:hypothetical protein